jgi:hypothetical protein
MVSHNRSKLWYRSLVSNTLPGVPFTQAYITSALTEAATLKYNQDPLKALPKCDLSLTSAKDSEFPPFSPALLLPFQSS